MAKLVERLRAAWDALTGRVHPRRQAIADRQIAEAANLTKNANRYRDEERQRGAEDAWESELDFELAAKTLAYANDITHPYRSR